MESYRQAKKAVSRTTDWKGPIAILNALKRLQPDDPYLIQQLALATYKVATSPTSMRSLVAAKQISRILPHQVQ